MHAVGTARWGRVGARSSSGPDVPCRGLLPTGLLLMAAVLPGWQCRPPVERHPTTMSVPEYQASPEELAFVAKVKADLTGGADVDVADDQGQTALHRAAAQGYQAAVFELLARGASRTAKDATGRTAGALAMLNRHDGVRAVLDCPACLILLTDALSPSVAKAPLPDPQSWGISYTLHAAYPANAALATLRKRLQELGYRPTSTGWMDGDPSSYVRGWNSFRDSSGPVREEVRSWTAPWIDADGNMVYYQLMYRYPENGPPQLSVLQVLAYWTTEAFTREWRRNHGLPPLKALPPQRTITGPYNARPAARTATSTNPTPTGVGQ